MMELKTIINTGLYASPILIGGLFYEKQPIVMAILIFFGCIILSIKLGSDYKTAKARREWVGYGDLK